VDAIGTDDYTHVTLEKKDAALLKFVKLLTLTPAETQDAHVQAMRDAGWTDEQIWEAAFEVSIFSLLNRMADAHGLDYPDTGWFPPELREKMEREQREQEKQPEKEPPKAEPPKAEPPAPRSP